MNKNMQDKPVLPPNNNKTSTTVGTIIILFGVFLLLKNLDLDFLFPNWFFNWQMILIIIGLVIGVNSKFQKKSSIILLVIGSIFLLRDWLDFAPGKVLIPALAIVLGIYLINRNRKTPTIPSNDPNKSPQATDEFDWDKRVIDLTSESDAENKAYKEESNQKQDSNYESNFNSYTFNENYLKVESIFGGSKKIILSKNFLGGTLTNIFGSSEINLLQADLQQPVVLDVFQLFSSVKIIVPPHWTVITSVSSILGENDDRRVIITHPDERKKIYITGTSIFSSVTLKNS